MKAGRARKRPGLGRRIQKSEWFLNAVGSAVARHIRTVFATSRVIREPENFDEYLWGQHPLIAAMWHGQFLLLPMVRPDGLRVRCMVARHTDAEMIGRALLHFDMELIRGAGAGAKGKDRGGAQALREALRSLDDDVTVAMTADVPPGPARVAGLGIVTLARMSGRPIVPLAIATNRFFTLPTWSRLTVNLPFSRIAAVAGDPILVPCRAGPEELEHYRKRVEDGMNATTERAYELAGSDARKVDPNLRRSAEPAKPGALLKIYKGLTWAARPASSVILKRRVASGKEMPERLGERRGVAGRARPEGPLWWLHAASVGETNAILPLIKSLRSRYPQINILLTTVTVTSARLAATRLPQGVMHQFVPLDSPVFVRRFLSHWRPDLALFTESEIWPNLILQAADLPIPLVLLNARMSSRSHARWSRLRGVSRPIFSRFDLVLAQDRRIAKRLADLGARHVTVAGNLKYDSPPPPADPRKLAELAAAIGGRPVFLAASTHPGEEEIVADAHVRLSERFPDLLTIIAPRHPERGKAIAEMLGARGLRTVRRSGDGLPDAAADIYIADTIGELGVLYSLAPVSFIGGSLVPHGGQNPLEAIKLGSAVIAGPHVHNFNETYRVLAKGEAFRRIETAEELAPAAAELLADEAAANALKERARRTVEGLGGALQKTLDALEPYAAKLTKKDRAGERPGQEAVIETEDAA